MTKSTLRKSGLFLAPLCAALLVAAAASAQDINHRTSISDEGNTKVNTVKAQQYMKSPGGGDAYDAEPDTIVHMGSAAKGDCDLNVGGTPAGNGKDVVVTAKNIINICK